MMVPIRSLTEAEARHMHELLRSSAARREHSQFVTEGSHLLEVALEKKAGVELCAFTNEARESALFDRAEAANIPIRLIPAKLARKISDTESTQGIFAIINKAKPGRTEGDRILALDGVQDPGNVGTLIRTALWFGFRTVLLGEGSADCYNSKVIRATQGAIFGANIHDHLDLAVELSNLKTKGYSTVATVLDPSAKPLGEFRIPQKIVIVLGNEAHGISKAVADACSTHLFIPRLGEGESLNVAATGAIALYQLTRIA
jgi:TrmH family RNA methyltransferase